MKPFPLCGRGRRDPAGEGVAAPDTNPLAIRQATASLARAAPSPLAQARLDPGSSPGQALSHATGEVLCLSAEAPP
jgi:hypothetical protein